MYVCTHTANREKVFGIISWGGDKKVRFLPRESNFFAVNYGLQEKIGFH